MKEAVAVGPFMLDSKYLTAPDQYMKERGLAALCRIMGESEITFDRVAWMGMNHAREMLVLLHEDYVLWLEGRQDEKRDSD